VKEATAKQASIYPCKATDLQSTSPKIVDLLTVSNILIKRRWEHIILSSVKFTTQKYSMKTEPGVKKASVT